MGFLIPSVALVTKAEAKSNVIYHIPIHEDIEKGLHAFLQRAFKEAEQNQADAIILDIHTPGGFTNAAGNIAKLMDATNIRTIAYINKDALSAGAFLALHADEVYMTPNGTMGAAGIIEQSGKDADKKVQSAWIKQMKAAAETKAGKDPIYAMAMADKDIDLPELGSPKGEFLTLSAKEAEQVKYSQGTAATLQDVLQATQLNDHEMIQVEPTFFEHVARFITNPIVIPILLSIASLGLIIELYSPGFGISGAMGLISLVLFFFGHLVAGFAGYETILLFILGAALIGAEFFIPGGIVGIIGIGAVIASIVMAGADVTHMLISVLIAISVAIVGMVIIMKVFGKKLTILNNLVLKDATTTEDGYVSNVNRIDLIGRTGKTVTPLRPSGIMDIQGERLDVVSEGAYIEAGKMVVIIKVEGSRIVVREEREEA
nr:nodulation protein NfeD [Lysinibacillus alkalisoli]